MKADSTDKAGVEATTGREAAGGVDPFAVDLFAHGRPGAAAALPVVGADAEAEPDIERRALWSDRLPSVARAQLRLSAALGASLPSLSAGAQAALARVLSHYLRLQEDEISVSQADVREREFAPGSPSANGRAGETVDVWATLALTPSGAQVFAALRADFASALVDRMLGGESGAPEPLRRLSPTELAAVEFLWLCLIRELHQELDAPVWRLDGVYSEPPARAFARERAGQEDTPETGERVDEGANARALMATFALRFGSLHGLVDFYFTRDALAALENLRHSPLFADERGAHGETYTRVAPDVRLRPVLGETDVRTGDLADLESGDVVVVARPLARLEAGRLAGRLEMRLGDGAAAVLSGRINANGDAATELLIEQIRRGGELHGTERGSMEQEQNGDDSNDSNDSNGSAIALEEILLTVHVELAQRRLSLDELARLRVGQLLALDCQATDPVDLVADGRRIARGELVEIEGRLGVRVTQVTGR